ncbi:uncharacterized protein EV420DRAFT_1521563 [Desarmillaria tabescens]|uniref:Uncharacterized protein n=1 Tax=Armillaria tabescens TaxID=1929756 RepID=A0AA39NC42_ARMTA|nr:uncharacterized protein EV420DRAFT_1521563 [Desarmillaria tabescens]KAK0462907.1 hypothetical protein EV420DRAFT_1521563 [Desarmillaria tabescens]
MAEKRELDSSSAEHSLAKRIKLARPVLRNYKALLEEVNMFGLGSLGLLLGEEDDDSEEPSKDDIAEIINAWKRPQKVQRSFTFSELPLYVLQNRLGVRTSGRNWIKSRMELRQGSKYYSVDLEPLYQELEAIYVSSNFYNQVASRSVVNAYLSFVSTTMKKEREASIKAAIKARIEASPSFDITPLIPPLESDDQVLSSFLEAPEGANSPSTLAEFSIDDKVNLVWWGNRLLAGNTITALEGVKDLWNLYLYPEIDIDSAVFKDASQDGQRLTLSGVIDYGMLVFKTWDINGVYFAGPEQVVNGSLKVGELSLLYVETKIENTGSIRFLYNEPLTEASAQALALSTLSNRPNIRFIVTNSSNWMLAHLRNGPSPEIVYMPPNMILKSQHPFERSYGSVQEREYHVQLWRTAVREIFMTLMEWLLPESDSLIKSPPPLSA